MPEPGRRTGAGNPDLPPDSITTLPQDQRPVCRGFPWYLDGPTAQRSSNLAHPRCSYLLEAAPADRPEGSRPLIPVEVVRR